MSKIIPRGRLIYVLFLMLPGVPLPAGTAELPRVANYYKADYGAQHQNWMIAQSPEGFLYFANSAGLLEYDGARWTLHPLPERQIVRAVACDAEGRVFTGGFGEFGYWQRIATGELVYHSLSKPLTGERVGEEEIWHILALPHRVLFQSFSTFYEYDYRDVRAVSPPGNIMFLQEVHDRVIVPVIGQGLFEWQGGDAFQYIRGSEVLADQRVSALLPHEEGFLVGIEQVGLLLYDGRRFKAWPNEAEAALRAYHLNRACRLPDGRLALGTLLNGLYILDRDGRLQYHLNKENGLQNNTILALGPDAAGDLWLGLDKGIDQVVDSEALIFYHDKAGHTGTTYSAAILGDQLYLGTNQGVYHRPWPTDEAHPFRLLPGTQGQVWELRVVDGQLLCGHNDGTFLIEGSRARLISSLPGGWMMLPAPGQPGRLIQGTYTGLVSLERDAAGQWRPGRRIGTFIQPVRELAFDREGFLWGVNPYRGLYRFHLSADLDSIRQWTPFTAGDGLPSEFRLRIETGRGHFAVRADTTLLTWNAAARRFDVSPGARRAPGGGAFTRIDGLGGEWFHVYPEQVVWGRDASELASFPLTLVPDYERIIALDEKTYLFCLDNGYALLDRWAARRPAHTPPPLIKQIAAYDQRRQAELLPASGVMAPPRLPARRNNLRFYYAIPSFAQPSHFRYRLNGFQEEWSAWSATAVRDFTNLPPGTYTFEVQANLSDQTARYSFVIRPHWHQTAAARILSLLILAALMGLLVRWHQYRLARQRRSLEIERERQLQQQRIRARNEQLQADVINKSKELANSTFNLIRKNEILLQVKEELQQLRGASGGRMPERYHQHLVDIINRHLSNEQDWEVFEHNFNQVHEAFFKRLMRTHPDLTPGDLRLAAYLKMNLTSKEIAPLLNISLRGVENKRYRLRRKLNLPGEDNLTEYLINF